MDGKIFLYSNGTPPRIAFSPDAFSFDLQRFDGEPNSESGAGEGGETQEAGNGLAPTPTTEGDGKSVFSCEIGGKIYYGKATDFITDKLKGATKITLLSDFTTSQGSGKETITKSDGSAIDTTGDNNATITLNPALELSQSCTLDLNGKTLTISSAANGIFVKATGEANNSNVLTLMDSSTEKTGKIKHTAIDGDKTNGAIKLGYGAKNGSSNVISLDATDNKGGVGLIMLGGTVTSTKSSAVAAGNNSTITIQDGCTLDSGSEGGCGVYFGNNPPSVAGLDSSLTMTGGTITSNSSMPAIQVSGTMTASRSVAFTTTLDISGGKIEFTKENDIYDETKLEPKGDPSAIYASGNTILKISGGEITSTGTGVELKEGSIEVTGGTVKSTAQHYNASPTNTTNNGATSFGAAIAISSTEKNKTIDVKISGDNTNISGANALAIANPKLAYKANVTATIDGGNLTSTKSQENTTRVGNAVLADNANVVITVNNGKLGGNVTVSKVTDTTNNDATIIVNGGTTTGDVQVVNITKNASGKNEEDVVDPNAKDEDGNLTEAAKTAKSALKVTGGRITGTSSAKNYVTPGTTVSDNGTVVEIANANGWSLQGDGNNEHYAYYIGTGAESIITASISGSTGEAITNNILRYDKTNKLFGIPTVASDKFTWVKEEENKREYRLAIYNTVEGGKAVTIKPETSSVKISGTGFIDSDVVTLTAATTEEASLGVEVDATENSLANIKGSSGKDKFIAGERNTTLDGGDGDDTLEGNSGIDLFLYSKGKDQINNYTYDSDIVSLNADNLTPPTDFNKATYDGKKIVIKFDAANANTMTFNGASKVAILKRTDSGTDTYTYDARSAGAWNYIAHEGNGISLGAGYTGTQYPGQNEEYKTIDASNVTRAIRIRGNDDGNYIVGSKLGGVLEGNDGNDSLYGSGATDSLTLNGGAGDDLLIGGDVYNNFVYSEGSDSISGYKDGTDLINVTGRAVSFADVSVSAVGANENNKPDLLIKFDNDNQLSIAGGASAGEDGTVPVISITSGRNNYAFTKDYFALNDKSITLTAAYADDAAGNKVFDGAAEGNTNYETINAGLVTGDISIVGNANNNYIVGGLSGNSLAGGDGDDTLVGGTQKSNLFYYTAGKDVIENFGASDKLAIEDTLVATITSGKLTNSRLTFTVDKNNSLTFKFGDNAPFESVSLQSGNAFLTKDGVASIKGENEISSLDLFGSAKGRIDLTETLYSGASIKSVNAESAKNQTVTLVGGTQGGTFAYATNKKRDGFEYGGGDVTISGYEGGRDRIDLNGVASLSSFTVDTGGVKLKLGNEKTISIAGAKDQEVLLRDAGSRGYKKMVFAATGVVQNKKSNPTMVTVSSDASNYSVIEKKTPTVKKIFVTDVSAGTSIQAGDRVNTIIDASNAAAAVSLSGGAKNDKLIGSTGDAADLFVYTGGKDVIQGFASGDSISLDGKFSLESAKITASKKSIKFKFVNKDVLTIKSNDTMSGALNINGDNKIYFKNAIGDSTTDSVSLTSGFSGTFRTQDSKRTALPTATVVNGSKVEKNLTFVGSSANETLIGGSNKNRKTMFKGGGGADSLVGGTGKDTFFYAKGNTGDATIANFDFDNDKIKVSSGIISKIEKTTSGAIKFSMTNGKSTDAAVGSFKITSKDDGTGKDTEITSNNKIAIKANNTYYWFAEDDKTYYSASTGDPLDKGTLITTENRISNVSAIPISGDVSVIDLNYSTNLAKNDIVAVKATTTKPNTTTT